MVISFIHITVNTGQNIFRFWVEIEIHTEMGGIRDDLYRQNQLLHPEIKS